MRQKYVFCPERNVSMRLRLVGFSHSALSLRRMNKYFQRMETTEEEKNEERVNDN